MTHVGETGRAFWVIAACHDESCLWYNSEHRIGIFMEFGMMINKFIEVDLLQSKVVCPGWITACHMSCRAVLILVHIRHTTIDDIMCKQKLRFPFMAIRYSRANLSASQSSGAVFVCTGHSEYLLLIVTACTECP